MRTFAKSDKLHGVCYDVRGPVLDAANEMKRQGTEILQLNIGNPAPFGFQAPSWILDAIREKDGAKAAYEMECHLDRVMKNVETYYAR